MKKILFVLSVLLLIQSSNLFAARGIDFVTYGKLANPKEGDDDFMQIFFIKINADVSSPVSIEIFDAECGGKNDVAFTGEFNSQFKFLLYGGKNAFIPPSIKSLSPITKDIFSGKLLKELVLTDEAEYDNNWKTFAKVEKQSGEFFEDSYYFKLVVIGDKGDDANVFNIRAKGKNAVEIFNYAPTIHLLPKSDVAQLRFNSGNNSKIFIKNYDVDGAGLFFSSPYRKSIKLNPSANGVWNSNSIELLPFEKNEICAIEFGPGGKSVNDAIFSVQNSSGNPIPVVLPIKTVEYNKRPIVKWNIKYLKKCNEVEINASQSIANNGNELTAKWVFLDGTVHEGMKEKFTFPNSGKYNITLAVKENTKPFAVGKYVKIPIVINSSPNAVAGKDKYRIPNEKILFSGGRSTDRDGYIKSYFWDFGDGNSKKGKTVSHLFGRPGIYNVKLTVTDNGKGNCTKSIDSLKVCINASPVAKAGNDIHCSIGELLTFDGSHSYDPDGHITSYQWFLGNGEKDSGEKISYVYKEPGIYKVTLKVKDDSNLRNESSSDELIVTVNKPPKANAGKDLVVAVGESFKLDGSKSYDRDGEITEFTWVSENNFTVKNKIVEEKFMKPGKYRIKLVVKDNSGTKNNLAEDSITVTVNAQPIAIAGEDIYQTFPLVKFDGSKSFDSDGKIIKYHWNFGDGASSNKIKASHVYKFAGKYVVILSVQDNSIANNNKAYDTLNVEINQKPIADAGSDLLVAPNELCKLSAFNSIDTDGTIVLTEWSLNNKVISKENSFNYSFKNPGIYNIKLKVQDNSHHPEAIDFDNIEVKVNEAPYIVTMDNYRIAKGESIYFDASKSFDNDGKIIKYSWVLNGNVLSSNSAFTHKFNNSGTYKIILNVTDDSKVSNSESRKNISIYVNARPVIPDIADILQCDNKVLFSASGTTDADGNILSYSWDFGDGNKGNGENIFHFYSKGGVYPVMLTADDGEILANSKATKEIKVKINSAPVADAGEDEIVCAGDLVTLDASNSFDADDDLLMYNWDFGDSSLGEGISVSRTFNESGIYQVVLTVTDNSGLDCNQSRDTKLLTVVESPVAFAGEDKIGCAHSPIEFDAYKSTDSDGIVNSFSWDFGDGSTGGGAKTTHIYDEPGVYNVVLTITGEQTGECDNMDTDDLTVTVQSAPLAEFTSPDSIAVNSTVKFNASNSKGNGSDIISYSWDFGDGKKANGKIVNHKYDKYGNYFVTLNIVTNSKAECKSAVILKPIFVNSSPIANASVVSSCIEGESIEFDASASYDIDGKIKKYLWSFGDGISAEGINVKHAYEKSGNYTVTLKVVDNTAISNNNDSRKFEIQVNAIPTGNINLPKYGFVNDEINISLINPEVTNGKITDIVWVINDFQESSLNGINYSFTEAGKYNVVAKLVDDKETTNEISKSIIIYPLPQITVKNKNTACLGKSIILSCENSLQAKLPSLKTEWVIPKQGKKIGQRVKVKFETPGLNKCKVQIRNPLNSSSILMEKDFNIFVNRKPIAAIVNVDEAYIGGANDAILFDASKSFDQDGDALSYYWDFGDRTSGVGIKVFHNYLKSGPYKVKLKVSDNRNCKENSDLSFIEVKIIKRK